MFKKFLLNIFFNIPDFIFKFFGMFNSIVYRGHALDDQTKFFLKLIPIKNLKDEDESKIKSIRQAYENRSSFINTAANPIQDVSYSDIELMDELILRKYSPRKKHTKKSILYFHGGGYAFGSINTHHNIVQYYSSYLGADIYSLNYSLSPENKYPKALNEAFTAYAWMLDNVSNEISVCGDSAGGHLAASLTNKLTKESLTLPCSQLLIYPMISPKCNFNSYKDLSSGYFLTASNMRWIWKKFVDNKISYEDPSCDLLKTNSISTEFPETLIITAGFDVLCDEAEKYAYLLHEKSINIRQLHYPSLIHGFASMSRLRKAKLAVDNFLDDYKKIL
jgi:acetyl esterase